MGEGGGLNKSICHADSFIVMISLMDENIEPCKLEERTEVYCEVCGAFLSVFFFVVVCLFCLFVMQGSGSKVTKKKEFV